MKNKTYQLFYAVLIIVGLLLSACGPQPTETPIEEPVEDTVQVPAPDPTEEPEPTDETPPEMMVFVDDTGYTLAYADYPQRIVSISASTTEILFAVGAGDQVVGRDDYSLFPEEAVEVTSVGALWGDLPIEAILALEPDLVVAAQIISEDQVQALRDLDLNVYWQANPASYEDLWENLRNIAKLTGHEEVAEVLITDLSARVKAVEEKIAAVPDAPSVFYELDATDPSAPWTAGAGTFIDYIITTAGGKNAASALEGDYIQISAEELIAVNPDVILLADALYGESAEKVAARPGWGVVTAVINSAIFPIDPNMMSVPGPRLVDALEETAKILHPEAFE